LRSPTASKPAGFTAGAKLSNDNATPVPAIALLCGPNPWEKYPFVANEIELKNSPVKTADARLACLMNLMLLIFPSTSWYHMLAKLRFATLPFNSYRHPRR
jgi:hypothetical protein